MLWQTDEFLLLAIALLGFAAVIEGGYQLGKRKHAIKDHGAIPHMGVLQAAVLGLLGLLFGFSLSMAVSRYEARKALVLEESNDIGTLWLRSQFLHGDGPQEVTHLLREYVTARIDFHNAGLDRSLLASALKRGEVIHNQLWRLAVQLAEEDTKSVPLGLFVEVLNLVIDDHEERRVALDNHVPDIVMLLLFANSLVALGFVAFSSGLSGRRRMYTSAIVAMLFGLVLMIILDIDRPRRGLVLVGQDSMLRLRDALATRPSVR
jgi:hypothetical protein